MYKLIRMYKKIKFSLYYDLITVRLDNETRLINGDWASFDRGYFYGANNSAVYSYNGFTSSNRYHWNAAALLGQCANMDIYEKNCLLSNIQYILI